MANNDEDDGQDSQVNEVFDMLKKLNHSQKIKFAKKIVKDRTSDNPITGHKLIHGIETISVLYKEYTELETEFCTVRDRSKDKLKGIIDDLDSILKYFHGAKAVSDGARLFGNILMIGGVVISLMGYTKQGETASRVGKYFDRGGLIGNSAMDLCQYGIEIYKQLNIHEIFDPYEKAREKLNVKAAEIQEPLQSLDYSLQLLSEPNCKLLYPILGEVLGFCLKSVANKYSSKINIPKIGDGAQTGLKLVFSAIIIGSSCQNLYEFKKKLESGHFSAAAEELRKLHDSM